MVALANDKVIDQNELAFIEKLVMADGVVDDEEKKVLRSVFERVDYDAASEDIKKSIADFRARYDV